MTVADFQRALRSRALGVRPIMAPNVHLLCGEQDWVEVTRAGYAYEYEIKRSSSDYCKDFGKEVREYPKAGSGAGVRYLLKHELLSGQVAYQGRYPLVLPRRFYFVFPAGLIKPERVPDHCGIIEGTNGGNGPTLKLVRQAPDLPVASKLSARNYHSLLVSMQERFFCGPPWNGSGDGS